MVGDIHAAAIQSFHRRDNSMNSLWRLKGYLLQLASGLSYKSREKYQYLLVIGVVFLSILREPLYFTSPRIWAEEGTVHIMAVLKDGPFMSLFQAHLGYYSLFNNFVGGLGMAIGGLANIAHVTTIASFAVILGVVLAPMFLDSVFWETKLKRSLIVGAALLMGSAEVWLNTVNCQFYFSLFSGFLLLAKINQIKGWRRIYIYCMIFNAALTGITSIVLLPFFLFKHLKSRVDDESKLLKTIVLILSVGALVQIFSFIATWGVAAESRLSVENIWHLPLGFVNSLIYGPYLVKIFVVLPLAFSVSMCFSERRINYERALPILIATYLAFVFALFSLGMQGGPRYAYAPSVLLMVFILNSPLPVHRFGRGAFLGSVVLLFIIFFVRFFNTQRFYEHSWPIFSIPSAEEVSDGALNIPIHPQWEGAKWSIQLTTDDLKKYSNR